MSLALIYACIAVGLLIIELITGTFIFLGLSISAGVLALGHFIFGDGGFIIDGIIFAIIAVIATYILRYFFVNHKSNPTDINQY